MMIKRTNIDGSKLMRRLETLVFALAAMWNDQRKKIDLILFFRVDSDDLSVE